MAETSGKTKKKTAKRAKKSGSRSSGSKADQNGKNLVVVESPAKAKTINRYLGNDYIVRASMGHVRDLPKKNIGVDIEAGFTPTYEPLVGRRKVLAELKKAAKQAPQVFLATDLDREGEAIAWHLAESLGAKPEKLRRVVFNEITAGAIRDAFAHPRDIDMDMVNAQQARRILDRIVGYQVSPLLWKKVSPGLSAGRVQSVAVRLIVERERDIDAFNPQEYWKISAIFTPDCPQAGSVAAEWAKFMAQRDEKGNPPTRNEQQEFLTEKNAFRAELTKFKGDKFSTDSDETAIGIAKALGLEVEEIQRSENPKGKGPAKNIVTVVGKVSDKTPQYLITALSQRQSKSKPPAPFTTSSLQQAASVQLRFSTSRTMRIAQQLYEGIEIPCEGSVGLITYMRTDSRNISKVAIEQVRQLIAQSYGDNYVPEKPNIYSSGQRAQEAHEAVRPTDASRKPEEIASSLNEEQFKLYSLIWKRFVASQMPPAIWNVAEAEITAKTEAGDAAFKALGRTLGFDGFLRVAGLPKSGDQILPALEENQNVGPVVIDPSQHFTQPPPRYTEASLVKALEAEGIGRPSTYAAIIQTIQARKYVEQLERSFHPTDLGIVVTDKLTKHFPKIFDVRFTAHMEDELDKVEESNADWVKVLEAFYGPFSENLKKAGENMVHAKAETSPSDYKCEDCGKEMVYRFSKNGRYLACTGYPDCKTTYPVDKEGKKAEKTFVDIACPKCGKEMQLRKGRFGPFLSCSTYPDCNGIVNLDRKGFVKQPSAPPLQIDLPCPKCESPLNMRRSKRGPWLSCSKYPKCRGRQGFKSLEPEKQKELELQLLNHEKENPQPVIKTLGGEVVGENHTPQPVQPEQAGKER